TGDVVFSCLKGAEVGDGAVLRLFNPNPGPEEVGIDGVGLVERIRLDEEAAEGGGMVLEPAQIATFRLRGSLVRER
ncbi:MAG: hypothetical protein JOY73_02095, partial [Actinobacteria bacterium]|nr:hypothetical protein [Actinomycetota bacterium]